MLFLSCTHAAVLRQSDMDCETVSEYFIRYE